MEKKTGGVARAILSLAGALLALAGAVAVLYKVLKKHLTFKIELHDEEHEVIDGDVKTEKVEEKKDDEIEISFVEEIEETETEEIE